MLDNGRPEKADLDSDVAPVSVAFAVQVNQDVRAYVPFIAKVGSAAEALLVGQSGEAAVISYSDDVAVLKRFEAGDVQSSLGSISANGRQARMIDAGIRAVTLLKQRPSPRARILIFIGQPMDDGSESRLESLKDQVEKENVAVYALALPEFGKAFVSDTFSLQGVSKAEKGGFKARVDLGRLLAALSRSSEAQEGTDPFSILTAATGGTWLRCRKQNEFEDALATVGVALRSAYLLSYSPTSTETGYHTIKIQVNVPGAKVSSRRGYWLSAE